MTDTLIRRYASSDQVACLALFDGNVPDFFAADERAEFAAHLQGLNAMAPYLVLERHCAVIACGGLSIDPTRRRAALSWGMVDRAAQGQGLGRRLTEARLALARKAPGVAEVVLSTSQHSRGFYARLGFAPESLTRDGFGPGLDRCDMVLHLG